MAYIALYRKWRPDSFKNLVGQEHVSRTLSNAITTGHVGHAYLFSGPRGTGKTSTAKILAKSLNCELGPTLDPCGVCESCRKISDGTSMDVYEIDAASNRGIDEIRDLRETVQYAPVQGRHKIYIIDEVHMLTTEAFNALLKTLEEPPSHVVFILATTEAHKVPATIQSRCQRYDFKRITVEDIFGRLQLVTSEMQVEAEEEALRMIAIRADGGMRDALSILDQCTALSEGKLTVERVQQLLGLIGREWVGRLAGAIASHDASSVLKMIADLLADGKDLQQLLAELSAHFRSLMLFQATGSLEGAGFYQDAMEMARSQVRMFTQSQMMAILRRLHEAMNEVKWSPQPRISVEAVLLELCQGLYEGRDMAGSFNVTVAEAPIAQPAADTGRIAQLEAQLEKMMRKLEEIQSSPRSGNGSRNASNKSSEGNQVKKMDALEAWKVIVEENKTGTLSFGVRQSVVHGVKEDVLQIGTRTSFVQDLLMNKMNKKLKDRLEALTGKKIGINCYIEEGQLTRPKSLPKKPKAADPAPEELPYTDSAMVEHHVEKVVKVEDLPPQQQGNLQKAIEIFGDHFVEPVTTDDFMNDVPMPSDDDYVDDIPVQSDEGNNNF